LRSTLAIDRGRFVLGAMRGTKVVFEALDRPAQEMIARRFNRFFTLSFSLSLHYFIKKLLYNARS
jgi:hypothetical protein